MATAPALPIPRRRRAPLTMPERAALAVVGVAGAGFALSGAAHAVPGTVEYVVAVTVMVSGVALVRRQPLPAPLAAFGAASVVLHLAGGLVRVGNDVLYNATAGIEVLRYDHLAHAVGIFVGTWLLWELLVPPTVVTAARTPLVMLALLAGLGLGAVNETVEFLATQAHGGGHVGGYTNTGWDLVVNSMAGIAAGPVLHRHRSIER
jgi:hypothetical protein